MPQLIQCQRQQQVQYGQQQQRQQYNRSLKKQDKKLLEGINRRIEQKKQKQGNN